MTDLTFVNKPHNNHYYEWGKNCITLGYDEDTTKKAIQPFGEMSPEDSDMFWEGYGDGPRESGEIYSLGITHLTQPLQQLDNRVMLKCTLVSVDGGNSESVEFEIDQTHPASDGESIFKQQSKIPNYNSKCRYVISCNGYNYDIDATGWYILSHSSV